MIEATGSRALGMGGAFVAVADDASATWWNPAGLAAGPYLDSSISRAVTDSSRDVPAGRDRVTGFMLGTPPVGLSILRMRITQAPTALDAPGREEGQASIPVRSLAATAIGVTVVQSVGGGVHIGSTLKYVRGRLRTGEADGALGASGALDAGDDLEGGGAQGRFDLDVGVLAVQGPVRGGAVMRNIRKPAFTTADGSASFEMPRQVRLGAAFNGDSMGLPLTVSFDADVRRYVTATGDRRVLAVGAEQWLFRRRIGLRAGGRFNRVGAEDRAATGGVSVKVRSGLYVDSHIVRGGNADDRGWGLAARVSF